MSDYNDPYDRDRRRGRLTPPRDETWDGPREAREAGRTYDERHGFGGRRPAGPAPARSGSPLDMPLDGPADSPFNGGVDRPLDGLDGPGRASAQAYAPRARREPMPAADPRRDWGPSAERDWGPGRLDDRPGRAALDMGGRALDAPRASAPFPEDAPETGAGFQNLVIRLFKLLIFVLFAAFTLGGGIGGAGAAYLAGQGLALAANAPVWFAVAGFVAGAISGFVAAILMFGLGLVMLDIREHVRALRTDMRAAHPPA